MAEEVSSFPNDYQVNPSALRELVEAREEVGRPRRLADGKEDLRNPERARETAAEEEKDVSRPDRIEDRVEFTQDAFDQNQAAERNRTGTQTEEGRESLQEAQDINPIREPRPSEIRDEPDGTAIETELGQNVSSLI